MTKSERIAEAEKEVGRLSEIEEAAKEKFISSVLKHDHARRRLREIWEEPED